jgi:hypothetical protein
MIAVDGLDIDHIVVLRFIGNAPAEAHDSKLLFTQGQWVRFLEALPSLRVILLTTAANNGHQTIKGNGLLLEYTFDLQSAEELPVDVRVFEILHRAVLSSHTKETLDIHMHPDPRTPRPGPLDHTGLPKVWPWLDYLCAPEWTRTLVKLFEAQENRTMETFGILGMRLVEGIRHTTLQGTTVQPYNRTRRTKGNIHRRVGMVSHEPPMISTDMVTQIVDKLESIRKQYPPVIFNWVITSTLNSTHDATYIVYATFLKALHTMSRLNGLADFLDRTILVLWEKTPFNLHDDVDFPADRYVSGGQVFLDDLIREMKRNLVNWPNDGSDGKVWNTQMMFIALFQLRSDLYRTPNKRRRFSFWNTLDDG